MADSVVVGILYPTQWYGAPGDFDAAMAGLRAVDPRVEVIVEEYHEGHDIRSARGKASPEQHIELRTKTPELTKAQAAALGKCEVVMAIDLPYDVAQIAPKLRWVQAVGAGTGQLQSAGLAALGQLVPEDRHPPRDTSSAYSERLQAWADAVKSL